LQETGQDSRFYCNLLTDNVIAMQKGKKCEQDNLLYRETCTTCILWQHVQPFCM